MIVIDTETTGLYDFRSPPEAPHQPHIVQLAAIRLDDKFERASEFKFLCQIPDGVVIAPEASKVTGITTEYANKHGFPIATVMRIFDRFCQGSELTIAHNAQFDLGMLACTEKRLGITLQCAAVQSFCTMLATKDQVAIPGKYGDFKWPKLVESYRYCFGEEFDGAHDALADVRACARIFHCLKTGGTPAKKEAV